MHPWVKAITQVLEPLADANNARHMQVYMRDQFAFYGIQSGPRRRALKLLFAKSDCPAIDELPQVIDELWLLPQREYQLVAIDLLIRLKNRLPISTAPILERCIVTKSWWDTVDMLATHIAGSLFGRYPAEFDRYIERWRISDNLWLRRTTLLYQLKYKQSTDFNRLSELIQYNRNDGEFFIQKAIGWSLREYSKTAPEVVINFINNENIQGLARREGLKWLVNNHPEMIQKVS
jgi:3-methyladenine DNA glycosylase AlkD